MNITIEDGVNGGVIEDSWMYSTNPNNNYGGDIHLGVNEIYGPDNGQSSTVRVDLSSYASMTPVSGKFLLRESLSNVTSLPAKCTKLLKDWGEYTVTWNKYDGVNNWDIAGAKETGGSTPDKAATTESTYTMTSTGVVDVPITVSTLIEWLTTNYGVILEGNAAPADEYIHAGSAEHTTYPIKFYFEWTEAATFLLPRGRMINL